MSFFQVTPASMTDAQEITDLIIACDIDEYGVPDIVLQDTMDILQGLTLETDTWVIRDDASSRAIIGFAFCEQQAEGKLISYGYVHPQHKGRGIGSELLSYIERRSAVVARTPSGSLDGAWTLSNVIPALNEQATRLLTERGYQFVRLYSRMNIDLTEAPPEPMAVPEIVIAPFRQSQDEAFLFEAYRESFRDSRLYTEKTMEAWLEERNGAHHDRRLWFTAFEGSEIAGFLTSKNFGDHVYVDFLGVKPSYRKRGIGLALLQHVLQQAYSQGITKVMLSVDAASLTNAHKLYARAGMKALFQMAMYSKFLKEQN
ncbi:GNAT family N-acetyltransferase [Paenibacillus zeisoli]|uniref:GNAT family N-acetyltransferase n=1 Tax=Paenibacillus zeisoli TaxID=2496267 RepID=A0A3S1D0P0_9BACL|nr:GNAT family N-acetyltransferase [Paenibacillus zeisoli]RUT33425.1 GNAT family N-acetyltransferase [Paenibacillus zeisoli]